MLPRPECPGEDFTCPLSIFCVISLQGTTYDQWSLVEMSWVDGLFALTIDGTLEDTTAFLGER